MELCENGAYIKSDPKPPLFDHLHFRYGQSFHQRGLPEPFLMEYLKTLMARLQNQFTLKRNSLSLTDLERLWPVVLILYLAGEVMLFWAL